MKKIYVLMFALLAACSEGDGCRKVHSVDKSWRQENLTLHNVEGRCVVVGIFGDSDSAVMAAVECPNTEK